MRNNRISWILLLMLAWARQSLQYSCEKAGECMCTVEGPNRYLVDCPTDSAHTIWIQITEKKFAKVQCHPMAVWSDLKVNSKNQIENVETFAFEQCSLPNSTLHEITQKIGVQPVESLHFESYMNLNSVFERRHLSGFPTLKKLSLNSNGLTNVSADLLTDLPELNVLQIRDNKVVLPLDFFETVPKLEWLELGNNELTHIDPMLFRSLKKLRYLALYNNQLTNFEEDTFKNLIALSTLEISNNNLTILYPKVLMPLGNLSNLQMNGNYFSSLPEDLLSKNLNLTNFRMRFNRGNLSTLPNRFLSNLPKLKEVDLISNKLQVLPEDIFWGSSSLKNLNLNGNLLSTLPKSIFNDSKNLQQLDLSSNKLTNLPDGVFDALSKLEKLELQRNNLSFISNKLFSSLNNLKELNLEHNGLRSLAPYSFYQLEALTIARLSHNQLTLEGDESVLEEFGQQTPFSNCKNLKELYLAYNNITSISLDWDIQLNYLRKLDLKYNQLSKISATDLQFLSEDLVIDITHNYIHAIDLGHAEIIATSQDPSKSFNSKNVRILIEENPIVCDCDLYDFLKYLNGDMHPAVQKLFHIEPGTLKCAGPEWMQHILVSDLSSKSLQCPFPDCPEECTCWFRKYDDTVIANCSHRSLTVAPKRISHKTGSVELDLTGNFLTEVPFINQSGYSNITKLLLSHNNISRISSDNIPPTLQILELNNNNLISVNSTVLELLRKSKALKNITLHNNPWNCDCGARDLLSFVQAKFKRIPNLLNVTCANDVRPISNMNVNDLCPLATARIVAFSSGIAFIGLLIGILAALYYKYQIEIKVWLYDHKLCLCCIPVEELDQDKLYDAFISYSHKDEDFVVNKLLPELEEGPRPFKLCLHFRDWTPGEWIPTQIANSVEDSRRTVVILSPNFLESVWGRMEFRTAHSQALSEGRARVIIILYGDIGPTENLDPELKAYLSMNTYVKWGDPWFWQKLRYALPHPPRVKENKKKKIFATHQHHIQIIGDKNGLMSPPGIPPTPPAATTPPADTLKTFTSNGSLNNGILITDYLKNEMTNFNISDTIIDQIPKKNDCDNHMINGESVHV